MRAPERKLKLRISGEGFGRVIGAARIECHKGHRPRLAAYRGHGACRQNETLRGEKNDGRIPVLMRGNIGVRVIGRCVRSVVMMCSTAVAVRMVLCAAIAETADVAGKRVGEMAVMMGVVQAVH